MIDFVVSKGYQVKNHVFRFEIESQLDTGIMLGIQGPSGSGKTTLLRCLAGLERPDAGFIRVKDQYWFRDFPRCFLPPQKRSAAYMFADYALFPHMTVAGNLRFARPQRTVSELLQMVHLGEFADHYPRELSSGQQQRAALARAVAQSADLLLLDEPFSALDESLRLELGNTLRKLQQQTGINVIMVSHSLPELDRLCDRVLII